MTRNTDSYDISELSESAAGIERESVLSKMASRLQRQGCLQMEVLAAVKAANAGRCDPPLSDEEVQRICDSAGKREKGSSKKKADVPDLEVCSGRELQEEELPELRWIVDDMIPQGLAILASPPKYGKSWWVLDLCLSVAAGDKFMGHHTEQTECLYLALEDSRNRLKERINKLTYNSPAPEGFRYAIEAETLDGGRLITQLERYLDEYPDSGLIVIDTLQRVKGAVKKNESAYSDDYRQMSALKHFADENDICVLVVHHLRKGKGEGYVFAGISGTYGILGSADTAIVLQKDSNSSEETTMHITGRDVLMDDIEIVFDQGSCRWEYVGLIDDAADQKAVWAYKRDPLIRFIKELLEKSESGEWGGTTSELFDLYKAATGEAPDKSPVSFGRKIRRIAELMEQQDQIRYFPPGKNGGAGGRKHTFRLPQNAVAATAGTAPVANSAELSIPVE